MYIVHYSDLKSTCNLNIHRVVVLNIDLDVHISGQNNEDFFLQLILGHYVLFYLNFVDKCNMIFS